MLKMIIDLGTGQKSYIEMTKAESDKVLADSAAAGAVSEPLPVDLLKLVNDLKTEVAVLKADIEAMRPK